MSHLEEDFSKNRVFCFESFSLDSDLKVEIEDANQKIDLPFECCSFENIDGSPLFTHFHNNGEELECLVLMIREYSPKKYRALSLERRIYQGEICRSLIAWVQNEDKEDAPNGLNSTLHKILNALNKSKLGVQSVSDRIKIGKNKEIHKIKTVVRVVPKKNFDPSIYSSKIDWSHRWEVMGHWRKIDGIGKDREGNYNTRGFTWIIPHVRGPEDKKIVKKIRVIPKEISNEIH
jgi:hypothetical protein